MLAPRIWLRMASPRKRDEAFLLMSASNASAKQLRFDSETQLCSIVIRGRFNRKTCRLVGRSRVACVQE